MYQKFLLASLGLAMFRFVTNTVHLTMRSLQSNVTRMQKAPHSLGQQRLCPACCLEARPSDILHQNHNEQFCIFDHLKDSLKQLAIHRVESCRVGKQSNKLEFLDLDLTTDTRTYIHCIPLVSSWKLPTCLYAATLFSSSAGDILLLVVVHEGAEHTSEAQTFLHCHMVHSLDTSGHHFCHFNVI